MSKVQIPPVLRHSTEGAKVVDAHGATLLALLNDLYVAAIPDSAPS